MRGAGQALLNCWPTWLAVAGCCTAVGGEKRWGATVTSMPNEGNEIPGDPFGSGRANDPHAEQIAAQVEEFRKQLLGRTLRNPLLNCPHGPRVRAQIRVVDELPDAVFERLEAEDTFTFLPLPEPRDQPDDEDSDEFLGALENYKRDSEIYRAAIENHSGQPNGTAAMESIEREARNHVRLLLGMGLWEPERGLGPEDLCRRRGIDPSHELPLSSQDESADRHHDSALQTLLSDGDLSPKLAHLRDRSRSSVSQAGVATLFAAFGFLEWFESDDSEEAHFAPLILVPGEIERHLKQGRYQYEFRHNGEPSTRNVTLAVHLRQKFGLELPAFETDDSPESYFTKVADEICEHRRRWRVRRFLTIGLFGYSKLAIYSDLDPNGWPEGSGPVEHDNIRTLLAQSGVSDIPYAENREIDADEWTTEVPFLIYDADSSQHSAIADVLSGKNLAIFGPPGTGKSQTIANTIAAAMMAGKSVLFVAEKLTALEVVQDRLEKAGLGPFCFNLHSRGLKSSVIRRSLEERVYMERPNFDPTQYETQKQDWMRQRDGLRTYGRVMGAKVGNFDETVHDVLWRTIDKEGSESSLPADVSATKLAKVEETAPAEVEQARNCIDRLVHAESEFSDSVEDGTRLPWRGAERIDLSPVEVGTTVQLVEVWERALIGLAGKLSANGLDGDAMTTRDARDIQLGTEAVQDIPAALECCELASLSREETRAGIVQAAARARRLKDLGDELSNRYGLRADELPHEEDLRSLVGEAASLGIAEPSAEDARAEAKSLLEQAARQDRTTGILAQLAECFGFNSVEPEILQTMERAVGLLEDSKAELLSSREDALMTRDASRILNRADDQCRELKKRRDGLAKRFELSSLPGTEDIQQAVRSLNAASGPLLFDGPAKRAMRLHRELSKTQSKCTKEEAAGGLRELIEYQSDALRLAEDPEIKRCVGDGWHGMDSDLKLHRRVADWAASVFAKLAGEGDGRSEARETLLSGDFHRLQEIRRVAEALPEDWLTSKTELDPPDARERAARLQELADGIEGAGLDCNEPLASANELAKAVSEYGQLTAETEGDDCLASVFPSRVPDMRTLELVGELAALMSSVGLSDSDWSRTAVFLANSADDERGSSELKQAVAAESEAWRACRDALRMDDEVFLDGCQHEITELGALRTRAREARNARDTLLSWSAYRRARSAVHAGHAAPVLAAMDKHGMSARRLREAYEWALYRSLAETVYRRHPELNELNSWQLQNHRTEFKALDAQLQELERARIAHELHSRPVEPGVNFGGPSTFTERALIQHQLTLQRRSVNLRELLRRSGTALRQLKPCFMMSPTTVAELLPRERELFDIAIIDEASQMQPSDALGSILRCSQAVIVGDPKQLPPSTYFQGGLSATEEDDDENEVLATMAESILDLSLSAWHPPRHLQWHYRSRHSSLIQFSNARFYDNRLIVFPGPDENREGNGIRYHHVADGTAKGGLNPIEAERVTDAACTFMADPANRDLSMAIVAMNQRQRDRINEMMDRESASNRAVEQYRRRWRNTLYPFIVRNLETVQGDERDVIFVSTVYGRESAGGPVLRRFGPITHPGGERRLNVLFSRARQRMEVFSSMQANEIVAGPEVSEGVRVLRDYLEYAATGKLEVGLNTGRQAESPFESHVMERLRSQGLEADPQVGVAGFRIDIGLRHPDYPHGYLLGIECDGRTYHSAHSVRDRDRLRESVLRNLGWDIYRIWSTDWFRDADRELRKLMDYVADRIEAFRAGAEDKDNETILLGEVVARPDAESASALIPEESQPEDSTVEPEYETLFVEVGDTVTYHGVGRKLDVRRVTIVRGRDDPANAIINDNKPLAVALLGAQVGESVTVRQPTSKLEIVVDRIERPETDSGDEMDQGPSISVDGVELAPYPEWRGHAADPRTASPEATAKCLLEIIETEGPVLEGRAYQCLVRACGIRRLGPQIRRSLNRALARLERGNRVIVERAADGSGFKDAVIRTPDSVSVKVRQIGPRSFDEVPLSELAKLIEAVGSTNPNGTPDEIYREVLGIYGLVRMTAQVRQRFEEAKRN